MAESKNLQYIYQYIYLGNNMTTWHYGKRFWPYALSF